VRGQSNGAVWQIDSQYPQARLAIGSDPSAGWPINAFGVQPTHFEIYWDGRSLFIADSMRVGGVTLNGTPVGQEWIQIRGRGEVVFGQASMTIETSEDAVRPIQTDPSIARRISVSPEHGTSEIVAEATRVADPSWTDGAALEGESTRIGEEGVFPPAGPSLGGPSLGGANRPYSSGGPSAGAPPAPPPGARPRLGGSPGGQGGLREQAPTLMGISGSLGGTQPAQPNQPTTQEATRMMSLDDMPPSVVVAPGLGSPPAYGAPPAFGAQPGAPGGFAPTAPPEPPAAGGFAMPAGGAAGGFAAPPVATGTKRQNAMANLSKVPPRTFILLGVTLVAALVALVMFFPTGEGELPPPGPLAPPYDPTAATVAPPAGGVAPPVVAPPVVAPPVVAPPVVAPPVVGDPTAPVVAPPVVAPPVAPPVVGDPTAPVVAPPVVAPPVVAPPVVAPPVVAPPVVAPPVVAPPVVAPPVAPLAVDPAVAPAVPGGPVVDPSTLPPTEDRRAADLAIAGRFVEALPIYQALALAHPERPEYGMMVRMLERRIADANCINGLTPDGRPCAAGGY
jgi:hypothetical protein